MKAPAFLVLSGLLSTAYAQTTPPPTTPATPQRTAERRAATYRGPKVVNDTKKLGRKFMQDSKPAPKVVSPVKQ